MTSALCSMQCWWPVFSTPSPSCSSRAICTSDFHASARSTLGNRRHSAVDGILQRTARLKATCRLILPASPQSLCCSPTARYTSMLGGLLNFSASLSFFILCNLHAKVGVQNLPVSRFAPDDQRKPIDQECRACLQPLAICLTGQPRATCRWLARTKRCRQRKRSAAEGMRLQRQLRGSCR